MDEAGGEKRRKGKWESSEGANFLNPMGPFWIKSCPMTSKDDKFP